MATETLIWFIPLPPLLAFAAILAASAFAALHLPFAALFRSRAPPACC